VIDVGAYTGLFTMLAIGAGAQEVIALEPNENAFIRLLDNLELNGGHPPFVTVLQAAASSEDGEAFLEIGDERLGICSTSKIRSSPSEQTRPTRLWQIDSLRRSKPVTVLKIDVEGHELRVLTGAAETLERDKPVVFVEVDSASGGDRRIAVSRLLEGFGYQGEPLDGRNMVFRVG
jgi:FkbM family methyltransferase